MLFTPVSMYNGFSQIKNFSKNNLNYFGLKHVETKPGRSHKVANLPSITCSESENVHKSVGFI